MRQLLALLLGCAIPVAGCSSGPDTSELAVRRGLDVAGVTVTDVVAPTDGEGLPVVVMLHGTSGGPAAMEPLARAVAERGVVVYVPAWPVIDQVAPYPSDDDRPYWMQAEAVVCALRFARRTAADFGGDPDELTLVGHSGGATAGARVALVDEPPWPGIDCEPGVAHAPDLFVGTGGDYVGEYQYAGERSELFAPYDPSSIDVTNLDLEVRLIHGVVDRAVDAEVSRRFDDRMRTLGVDSAFIATDTGHSDLRDPTTPAGRFVVDTVSALVHSRPSVFDQPGRAARMTIDDAVCDYSGPDRVAVGDVLRMDLRNAHDEAVWTSIVRIDPGSDVSLDQVRNDPSPAGEGPPNWVSYGAFFRVPGGATRQFDWAVVDGGARWVIYCMSDPDPGNPMSRPMVNFWGGPAMRAASIVDTA